MRLDESIQESDRTNNKNPNFFPKQIPKKCFENPMPEFDEIKASLLDENGKKYKDTIIERIAKRRIIFKPCREYIFKATLLERDEKLISQSQIKMMATGSRWSIQPELQDEVLIQYEYKKEDVANINKHQINKIMSNSVWRKSTKTGIIENVKQIWMHPFRSNQFLFTEVAPFPEVKWPLYNGKSWTGELNIYNGWGDWNNSSGKFVYKVENKEDIQTQFGLIGDCWKIESIATYPFGKSFLDYWFNEELGFVKMNYINYEGQKLNIELVEVVEN